ncbi:MAG TPA: hypothetical protein GXX14_13565 [Clostridiaceae bacterium]|nr:hypothetical protein [Clostridiaceae bacterium]
MRIKNAILIVLIGMLVITSSCSMNIDEEYVHQSNDSVTSNMKEEQNEENTVQSEDSIQDIAAAPSLGGISLGDTSEDVVANLGDSYSESTESDVSGFIGEDLAIWNYDNGITVSIGKTSGKVLRIVSSSPDFKTDLGIKVGDVADTVFKTYKPMFKEAVSRHSDETLVGWFIMKDGAVIIFDFDKSDDTLINSDITSDSEVEEIILSYWKYFD